MSKAAMTISRVWVVVGPADRRHSDHPHDHGQVVRLSGRGLARGLEKVGSSGGVSRHGDGGAETASAAGEDGGHQLRFGVKGDLYLAVRAESPA